MFVLCTTVLLLLIHNTQSTIVAKTVFHADSSNKFVGYLTFTQISAQSPVVLRGKLWDMAPNRVHGFHVHQSPLLNGQLNCSAAGPHFNPFNTTHGPRTANIRNRHVGDLGNVTSDRFGKIKINILDSIIQLFNTTQSIVNRTIILHIMRDDGGTGGFPDSRTTGNAGARIACGNIIMKKFRYKY